MWFQASSWCHMHYCEVCLQPLEVSEDAEILNPMTPTSPRKMHSLKALHHFHGPIPREVVLSAGCQLLWLRSTSKGGGAMWG